MTDFEKEQADLRERFYYDEKYGDKLMRFYLEMTIKDYHSFTKNEREDLPF